MFGVLTWLRDVEAASPKISASFNDVMSDVVNPIESKWQVRIGPATAVLLAVFRVSRPVVFDFCFPELILRGASFNVSKSLKRPPAIVYGV